MAIPAINGHLYTGYTVSSLMPHVKYPTLTDVIKRKEPHLASHLPVFNQLLNGIGRALNNFSCGNAVDNSLVEPPDDTCHVHSDTDPKPD